MLGSSSEFLVLNKPPLRGNPECMARMNKLSYCATERGSWSCCWKSWPRDVCEWNSSGREKKRGRLIKKPFMKHSDPDHSCCTVFLGFPSLFVLLFISLHYLSRSPYAVFWQSKTLCSTKACVKYIQSRTKQRRHLRYFICPLIALLATHLDITHHTRKTHPHV